jgi:site-specific DNA-methyltransferase (adenine-specific)
VSFDEVLAGAKRWHVAGGDCRELLRALPDACIDAVVCDPPYGLEFMGAAWDRPWAVSPANATGYPGREHDLRLPSHRDNRNANCRTCGGRQRGAKRCSCASPDWDRDPVTDMREFQKWCESWAREVFRVLKPGGFIAAFGGTRTVHRMTCAIEDAGFEIRDGLCWEYGCLSADTEILVDGEWCPYGSATVGRRTLCYDPTHDEFSWQPILETVEYPYNEIAWRVVGEHTDHLVSRNHRCVVAGADGRWRFALAEDAARESALRVPVLEDVRDLLTELHRAEQVSGCTEHDMFTGLRGPGNRACDDGQAVASQPTGNAALRDVRCACDSCAITRRTGGASVLLDALQREGARLDADEAREQGARGVDTGVTPIVQIENERRTQPGVEGWAYTEERGQVRALPAGPAADGTIGRLRDGASADRGPGAQALPDARGDGASHRPRSDEQRDRESGTIRHEPRSQTVRGAGHTIADLVRFEPVAYSGTVWCVRVPTGAFVARRNGRVFVTGNSGFPKSLDVGKAIDEAAGATREVIGTQVLSGRAAQSTQEKGGTYAAGIAPSKGAVKTIDLTAPPTDDAKKWDGWGTALKPSWEPVVLARRPLIGTVAQNVLAHGTGALNVDACRVVMSGADADELSTPQSDPAKRRGVVGTDLGITRAEREKFQEAQRESIERTKALGRWPPNVLLSHNPDCERIGTMKVATGTAYEPTTERTYSTPAQVMHSPQLGRTLSYGGADGTEEVAAFRCAPGCPVAALDAQSGEIKGTVRQPTGRPIYPVNGAMSWNPNSVIDNTIRGYGDSGGASRFFPQFEWQPEIDEPFCYTAKSSRSERNLGCERLLWVRDSESDVGWRRVDQREFNAAPETERFAGNPHATVKPVAVMTWLAKLICPPGGIICDPFTGSGTTGVAAMPLGLRFIGCELNAPYVEIASARIAKAANRGVQKSLFDLLGT